MWCSPTQTPTQMQKKCIFDNQFPGNRTELSIISDDFWSATIWVLQIKVSFPRVEIAQNPGIQPSDGKFPGKFPAFLFPFRWTMDHSLWYAFWNRFRHLRGKLYIWNCMNNNRIWLQCLELNTLLYLICNMNNICRKLCHIFRNRGSFFHSSNV